MKSQLGSTTCSLSLSHEGFASETSLASQLTPVSLAKPFAKEEGSGGSSARGGGGGGGGGGFG